MSDYNVKNNALIDGNIEENYNYLFNEVNNTKTRFIRGHLKILREYASECNHITEMGVDSANTTWSFLSSRPKKLISIDILNTKAPSIIKLAEDLAKKENIDFKFILGSTLEIEIEPTEFLFIDTQHTYNQLKTELNLHSNKVSKYIAMHDTSMFPDMNKALIEFLNTNWDWEKVYETEEWCGLTIIKRK